VQAGGTIPFVPQWWNFFNNLLAYIVTGPIGPVPLVGVTDGSSAAAGNVGEYLSSIVPASPGVSLTSTVSTTITSLTLTAGDWDMWGEVSYGTASVSSAVTQVAGALWNTAANAFPAKTLYPADGGSSAADAWSTNIPASTANIPTVQLGPMRVNITTNTTFFLSASPSFSSGTLAAGGAIRARRMR
jgi:hypothetical protein